MCAKARVKGVRKKMGKAAAPWECLFIDISCPYPESITGSRYWFDIIDDFSRYGWTFFGKKKCEMVNMLERLLVDLLASNYKVKSIRCDNTGEQQSKLQLVCK